MSSEERSEKADTVQSTHDTTTPQTRTTHPQDADNANEVDDAIPFDISLEDPDRPHRPTPSSSKHKWHEQEPHKHRVKARIRHHHAHQGHHDKQQGGEHGVKHDPKTHHDHHQELPAGHIGHGHKATKALTHENTKEHQRHDDLTHIHHKTGHHPAKKPDDGHKKESDLHVTGQHIEPDHEHAHTSKGSHGAGHSHEKHVKHPVHHGDESLKDGTHEHGHSTGHHTKHGSEYKDPKKAIKPSPHVPQGYEHQEMHSLSHHRVEHPQSHPHSHPHPHQSHHPVHHEQQQYGERPHVSREDTELELPTGSNSPPHDAQAPSDHGPHGASHGVSHTTHASHHAVPHSDAHGRDIHVEDWATANVSPTLRRKAPLPAIPITHDHIHLQPDEQPNEEHRHYTEAVHTDQEHDHMDGKPYAVKTCSMHVEHGGDKKECWITGFAVLSPDRVVVADYNNNRIKVISVERGETMSRIVLPTSPKDVTVVNDKTLAATLPAMDVIQFIAMDGQLPILDTGSTIKVAGYCNGIEHHRGELYVSFTSPPKVEILSLKGEVLHSIANDYHGHPMFKTPQYLAIYNNAIFVSDSHNNAVIKVSRHGDVLGTYTDVDLKNPQGIVMTPSGQLLVCGQDTHNVHLVTSDCHTVSVFLDRKDGIWWPHVIGICPDTHTIYISSTSGDVERDNFMRLYEFSDIKPLSPKLMGIHGH